MRIAQELLILEKFEDEKINDIWSFNPGLQYSVTLGDLVGFEMTSSAQLIRAQNLLALLEISSNTRQQCSIPSAQTSAQRSIMAWRSSGYSNAALITNLVNNGLISSDRVKHAMLNVRSPAPSKHSFQLSESIRAEGQDVSF